MCRSAGSTSSGTTPGWDWRGMETWGSLAVRRAAWGGTWPLMAMSAQTQVIMEIRPTRRDCDHKDTCLKIMFSNIPMQWQCTIYTKTDVVWSLYSDSSFQRITFCGLQCCPSLQVHLMSSSSKAEMCTLYASPPSQECAGQQKEETSLQALRECSSH